MIRRRLLLALRGVERPLKIVLLVNNNNDKADAVRTENWDQHLVISVDPRDELPLKKC